MHKRNATGTFLVCLLAVSLSIGAVNMELLPRAKAEDLQIYVNPPSYVFSPVSGIGQLFNVTCWINTTRTDLGGLQVCMEFNDSILAVTRWYAPDSDAQFFMPLPYQAFPSPPNPCYVHVGPSLGRVTVAIQKGPSPPSPPYCHSGKICILEFNITALPSTEVNLTSVLNIDNPDTFAVDSGGDRVEGIMSNGYYELSGNWTIYIRADGSVDPSGAPILRNGDFYALTGNITSNTDGIAIERDNMTLDGAGSTLKGGGSGDGIHLSGRNNVTIKNMKITAFASGIWLNSSSNNSMSGNNITANNGDGIYFVSSSNNTIYHNNMNNTSQVYSSVSTNVWDNGYPSGGNFWSDYNGTDEKSGPSQTQPGYDGIGDVPYIIAANNTDSYPFMQPLTGEGVLIVQTPTGSNVTVSPMANASITFANVTAGGFTSWNTVQPATEQFVSVTCNEIRTSANYTGNVTLEFAYDPSGLSLQDQQAMKLWLWNDSSASWVDITTSVNTTSHTVYGASPHLSVFGITRDLGLIGDLDVQGTTTVSIPSVPPPPPHNLSVLNFYQINTTKNLGTPINLSLAYDPGNIQPGQEVFIQMWLWNESSTGWVDITTNVNTTTHTVYGISPHLSVFGITNLQSAPSGITVTNVNSPKTVVCQGYNATIGFTITNQGDITQQNFNILLYCNTTLLATLPITRLEPYSQIALSYNWSTTTWVKGNYSINTCSNSIRWIKVTIVGDVNGDGKVNLIDVFAVALAYGSYPGRPTWNPNYDINDDGKINLIDYFTTALNYGKSW